MSQIEQNSGYWFVRNESGKGFRPAHQHARLLVPCYDVASGIFAAIFFWLLLTSPTQPWWLFHLAGVFGLAPLLAGMFFSGRGPISSLLLYSRQWRGK